MKSLNLIKEYEKLREKADDYLAVKIKSHEFETDDFFLIVVQVGLSPIKNKLRLLVDSVNEDFEKIGMYYMDIEPDELDTFISTDTLPLDKLSNFNALTEIYSEDILGPSEYIPEWDGKGH